jgi:hypothetical protein
MDDYVDTTDDNGGVHLNSGIPNKAFQLAAVGIGGTSIEGAGRVWYDALVGGDVPEDADFATFAAATVAAAGPHADAVREAWSEVGVQPSASPVPAETPVPGTGGRIRVERSGGFIGRTEAVEVDLDDDLRGLVADAALSAPLGESERPMPDMYVYTFTIDDGDPVRVPEHRLTTSQAELARRIIQTG